MLPLSSSENYNYIARGLFIACPRGVGMYIPGMSYRPLTKTSFGHCQIPVSESNATKNGFAQVTHEDAKRHKPLTCVYTFKIIKMTPSAVR